MIAAHGHDELIAFNYPNIVVQKLDGANMISSNSSAKQNRGKEQIVLHRENMNE
jgi:hypothetical protein